jgi:hypothetical protein
MSVVDIYHQWTGDQFGLQGLFNTSTTIFGQWTGDQFGLQGLFDMGGGHLPPYLCSGLVINFLQGMFTVVSGGHLPPFGQWTGDQFGLQGLFNMGGGHLPP